MNKTSKPAILIALTLLTGFGVFIWYSSTHPELNRPTKAPYNAYKECIAQGGIPSQGLLGNYNGCDFKP